MGKDDANSTFDFDQDPEFNTNFYKNIEMAFGTPNVETPKDTKETDTSDKEEVTEAASEDTDTVLEESIQKETEEAQLESEETAAAELIEEPATIGEIAEEDIEEELTGIHAELARKICEEMDCIAEQSREEKKKKHFMRIRNGALLTLLCLIGFGFFFGFTKPGNLLLMRMGVNLSGKIWSTGTGNFQGEVQAMEDIDRLEDDDLTSKAEEVDPETIVWSAHPGKGRQEEGVYNILLLGEEAIGAGTSRGRTDVIVIATMNTNTKKLMLTSLLRDTLVQIPGYKDNKLNTAYEKGGVELLYETIALNFDLHLDGCAMVNFEDFEKIIDKLGGLELTLTSGEARYLNSTNYISKPQYRNVRAGTQHMNGNQVLGYARVRKRATITGNNNDYGRTDRHRIVLNAIFEKYKTKSKVDLATIMLGLLPMITTDIDSDNFELLLNAFIEMGTMEITQMRIPADGTFTDNVKVRGMDVLIPDLQENVKILHNFIFGEDTNDAAGTTQTAETSEAPSPSTGN